MSAAAYHKKDVKQASLCSVGVRMGLDRQRDMTSEMKFVFSCC